MNQKVLKIIAMLSMLIDHIAIVFGYFLSKSAYTNMRIIGRFAFPIYAFLAAEAVIHTHSRKKYLIRLAVLALVSEIPYDLAIHGKTIYPDSQNVIFTLFFGAAACICMQKGIRRVLHADISHAVLFFALTAGCLFAPALIRSSYGISGALSVFLVFLVRRWVKIADRIPANIAAFFAASLPVTLQFRSLETVSLLSPVLFLVYNGKNGGRESRREKLVYRLFYPAHLTILWLVFEFFLNAQILKILPN